MEEALQENVGHTDEVVVLLSLVEGVAAVTVALVVLDLRRKQKKKGEELKDTHCLFYLLYLLPSPRRLPSSLCNGLSYPPVCFPASQWSKLGSPSLFVAPGWLVRSLLRHAVFTLTKN